MAENDNHPQELREKALPPLHVWFADLLVYINGLPHVEQDGTPVPEAERVGWAPEDLGGVETWREVWRKGITPQQAWEEDQSSFR